MEDARSAQSADGRVEQRSPREEDVMGTRAGAHLATRFGSRGSCAEIAQVHVQQLVFGVMRGDRHRAGK